MTRIMFEVLRQNSLSTPKSLSNGMNAIIIWPALPALRTYAMPGDVRGLLCLAPFTLARSIVFEIAPYHLFPLSS